MRYITPIILLILSIASFLVYTNPTFNEIKGLQTLSDSYNTALNNAQQLQQKRDALTTQYNSFSPDGLARLSQFLPDSADNIHTIIDLQGMAQAYGMAISSTKFTPTDSSQDAASATASPLAAAGTTAVAQATQDYGTFDLIFVTSGTYDSFIKFLKDVESSLRLTDIESVTFSSDVAAAQSSAGANLNSGQSASYTYTIKLRTYWLKPQS